MADNFVRKTVQKTNNLPKLDFYELGDVIITSSGSVSYVTIYNNKKTWVQVATVGVLNGEIKKLKTRLDALEKTAADHEKRLKALEATP